MNKDSNTIIKLYEDGTVIISPVHISRKLSKEQKEERKKLLTIRGNMKKTYSLNSAEKRLIRCSAIRLFRNKKNSVKWFTLTFPGKISQADANKCLSKFLENLKQNYNANNYVIIKENHLSGNPHFHYIIDLPFVNFAILNRSWNSTFRNRFEFSRNALTTGKKKTIDNIQGIAFYVTKYITKADQGLHDTRIYFISQNCLSKPKILSFNEYVYITTTFKIKKRVELDYCTFYFLENFAFCPEMLCFHKEKIPKPPKIKRIPDYIQPNLSF